MSLMTGTVSKRAEVAGHSADGTVRFAKLVTYYAVGESVLIATAAFVAGLLYWQYALGGTPESNKILWASIALALGIGCLSGLRGHYDRSLDAGPGFMWSGMITTLKAFGVLIGLFFLAKVAEEYSRGAFLAQFAAVSVCLLVSRGLFQRFVREKLAAGRIETQRVMIIGGLANDAGFLQRLATDGVRVVASFPTLPLQGDGETASMKAVVTTCRTSHADHVVIRASGTEARHLESVVDAISETTATVQIVPAVTGGWHKRNGGGLLGAGTSMINNRPLSLIDLSMKRVFDLGAAFAALIVLAPVFVAVAIAIRLDSKGPVFFRQTRHGYGNRPISVFKFRSMRVLEDGAAFRQATKNDPRITRVGAFLRRTNLDELPQILNVLFGEMSIVGPRPHPIALNESFADRIKLFNRRHNIRPGITGWAQINGYRGETETLQKMASRVEHDLWYVDNWSFLLDLKIVLMTVFSPTAYRNAG